MNASTILQSAALCLALSTGFVLGGVRSAAAAGPQSPLRKALIVDGQNNHATWPQTTRMMRKYPEESGLFTVDVVTHAPKGEDPSFAPAFGPYAVVVSNFGHGAAAWPAETRTAFEDYVHTRPARNGTSR